MTGKEKQPVDWRQLKLRNGNRDIKERHVAKLKASIKAHGFWPGYPIIHNARLEIIAGQHRWQACKELDAEGVAVTPAIIQCDDIDVQTLIEIERAGGVWNTMDIICAYAKLGHKGAQAVKQICEDFHASPRVVAQALGRDMRYNNIEKVTYSDEEIARAVTVLAELSMFTVVANSSDIYRRQSIAGAYVRIRKINGFSPDRLRDRLKKYGREKFVGCTSARAQLRNLIDLYNFNTSNEYRLAMPAED